MPYPLTCAVRTLMSTTPEPDVFTGRGGGETGTEALGCSGTTCSVETASLVLQINLDAEVPAFL
jgi:hypothetical protein